jgi:hypothetical protein
LHAGFATNAALVVEVDDAIMPAKKRHGRTDLDARRIVTMITAKHGKVTPGLRINAFLDVLDPRPIHSHGNIVFFLACDRAGMTANATVLIDEKSVAHLDPFSHKNPEPSARILRFIAKRIVKHHGKNDMRLNPRARVLENVIENSERTRTRTTNTDPSETIEHKA